MLRLIGLLMLVLIGINLASKPKNWTWLTGREAAPARPDAAPAMKDVDFSVRMEDDRPLPEGVFRVEMADPPLAALAAKPAAGACDTALAPELLRSVRDRTLGLPASEAGPFFAVLKQARDLPPGCLDKAGKKVPFTVLMTQTDQYRGVPVTIEGTLRKLSAVPAGENAAGIERYYEAWLTTRDSGSRLYRVVTATNAAELPEGEWADPNDERVIRVRTTGYFFKSEGYATRGGAGLTVAPLLIGRSLAPLPAPPPAAPAVEVPVVKYVIAIGVGLAVVLGVVLWLLRRGDRQFEETTLRRFTDIPPEQFDTLKNVETTGPADLFRQLAAGRDEAGQRPDATGGGAIPSRSDGEQR